MKRKRIMGALLYMACASVLLFNPFFLLHAQIMDAAGPGSGKGDYKLAGTVVNSATGEPVRRALVNIYSQGELGVLTDPGGKFEFEHLSAGQVTITVRKPGFFTQGEVGDDRNQPPTVMIGPENASVTIKLVPEAVIFGRAEIDGEPTEDLPVRAMAQRIHDGRKVWVQQWGGSTNADGTFRIASLLPGTYYLSAGPHWDRPAVGSSSVKKGFAQIFYADADDPESATPIQVSAGQQSEVDFSIRSQPLFHISGRVGSLNGLRVNLEILTSAGTESALPIQYNAQDGAFQTIAPAGNYTLQAQTYGPNNAHMTASVPLHVQSDVSGIQLSLVPAITIPIYVHHEEVSHARENESSIFTASGVDRNGKQYSIVSHDGGMQVILQTKGPFSQHGDVASSYRMAGDTLQLELADIQPGRYSANFTMLGGGRYVRSAQCGSVDLLHEDLVLIPGVQPPPIEVVVRNDAAMITGEISGDTSSSAAYTLLLIPDGEPSRTRKIAVFSHGHFQFEAAPGDYFVLALEHAGNLEYTNPEVLNPYLARAQHVSLHADEKVEVNPDLVKVER